MLIKRLIFSNEDILESSKEIIRTKITNPGRNTRVVWQLFKVHTAASAAVVAAAAGPASRGAAAVIAAGGASCYMYI